MTYRDNDVALLHSLRARVEKLEAAAEPVEARPAGKLRRRAPWVGVVLLAACVGLCLTSSVRGCIAEDRRRCDAICEAHGLHAQGLDVWSQACACGGGGVVRTFHTGSGQEWPR